MPTPPVLAATRRLLVIGLAAGLGVTACTGIAAPPSVQPAAVGSASGPSVAPGSPAAAPSLDPDAIEHPTGPHDIVLRTETRGGFVRLETVMGRLPEFTLYGDGRALVLPPGDDPAAGQGGGLNPGAAGNEPVALPALREAHLTEAEVQALLQYALVEGRLGTARDAYMGGNMDAPSTVIDLHADGADRSILVTGLTDDPAPGPDAAAMRAFSSLIAKLRTIPTDADYATDRRVAVIAETEAAPGVKVQPWPWADLAPSDFPQPADDAAIPFPSRLLSEAEVAEAGALAGGNPTMGAVKGPDGRDYVLLVRPALPDEIAAG